MKLTSYLKKQSTARLRRLLHWLEIEIWRRDRVDLDATLSGLEVMEYRENGDE